MAPTAKWRCAVVASARRQAHGSWEGPEEGRAPRARHEQNGPQLASEGQTQNGRRSPSGSRSRREVHCRRTSGFSDQWLQRRKHCAASGARRQRANYSYLRGASVPCAPTVCVGLIDLRYGTLLRSLLIEAAPGCSCGVQRGVKRGARHHADAEAGHAHAHGVLRSLSVVLRWYRRLWAAVHVPGSFV
jgi:hypothetical protein